MAATAILLSDFTDPRFRTAFQIYFSELNISVKDWDGLFQEMNAEKINRAYLLLEDNGDTMGFIQFQMSTLSSWFFEEPFGFIREFWVHPAYRRQGHGKALLHMAEAYFAEHGAGIVLLTADNAVNFYLANGYKKSPGMQAKNKMEVLEKAL